MKTVKIGLVFLLALLFVVPACASVTPAITATAVWTGIPLPPHTTPGIPLPPHTVKVKIVQPHNGQHLKPGKVPVAAMAALKHIPVGSAVENPTAIAEVYIDGKLVAKAPFKPIFRMPSSPTVAKTEVDIKSPGVHTITVKAFDRNHRFLGQDSVRVVVGPVQPPHPPTYCGWAVKVIKPHNGQVVVGNGVVVEALASMACTNPHKPIHIQLTQSVVPPHSPAKPAYAIVFVDGKYVAKADFKPAYRCLGLKCPNSAMVARTHITIDKPGKHTITVKAFDRSGKYIGQDSVRVAVKTAPPRPIVDVKIVQPHNGQHLKPGKVPVAAMAVPKIMPIRDKSMPPHWNWNPAKIAEVYLDGKLVAKTTFKQVWFRAIARALITIDKPGRHTITVKAFDRNHRFLGQDSVRVVVERIADKPPVVKILHPRDGQCLPDARTQFIKVFTKKVTKVEFFVDGKSIGPANWHYGNCYEKLTHILPGRHTITAVAYDNAGHRAEDSVTVCVMPPVYVMPPQPLPPHQPITNIY